MECFLDGRGKIPDSAGQPASADANGPGRSWPCNLASARERLRGVAISASSLWPASRGRFVRCLYLHNVLPRERAAFKHLLREIKTRGDVVSTAVLVEILSGNRPPSGRYFHLSFDDGYANVVCDAAAIMAGEKVTATFFVATGYIRGEEDAFGFGPVHDYAPNGPWRPASWSELRDAAAAGFEIGSHSHSHTSLASLSGDSARLRLEIVVSRQIIERNIGAPCTSFAWPRGRLTDFDARAAQLVRQAGYTACFSGVRGSAVPGKTDRFAIPRHLIEAGWPLAHQRAFLDGRWEGRN